MSNLVLRVFSEEEYHLFFRYYQPDPMMNAPPFLYNREQISRSYLYNHGGFRENYAHFGIFLDEKPIGSFQLKRIDKVQKTCEFGIILQNDFVKNRGFGTDAIREGMRLARDCFGMERMSGDTMKRNQRMIHVFEKLGFQLIEKVPDAFILPDGHKEDRLVYSILLTEAVL